MKLRLGLRSEIVTGITLLVLGMILLITLVVLRVIEWVVLQERIQTAERTVHLLQGGLEEGIGSATSLLGADLAEDRGMIEKLRGRSELHAELEALRRNNGLYELFLLNPHFQIVLATHPSRIGERWKDRDIVDALYLEKILTRYREEHLLGIFLVRLGEMKVTAPFWLDGRIAGVMRFTFPMHTAQHAIQKAQFFVFLYLCLDAIVFILCGSFLFFRSFVRPLTTLTDTAEKVVRGDFTARTQREGESEIDHLCRMFDLIVETLEAQEIELAHLEDHLEGLGQELAATQALAIHAEKMATIGQLAAGVAHEIGNPLGAIFGYLDMLKGGTTDPQEREEIITALEAETARIDRIVRELLDYSRPAHPSNTPEDLNAIVRESIAFLQGQKRLRRLTFEVDLEENLPRLPLDAQKFRQVMINLILNAADAMGEGGILRIVSRCDTWRAEYDERHRGLLLQSEHRWPRKKHSRPRVIRGFSNELRPGRRIVTFSVTDTGVGIEASRLERIFDPFYTTKPAGKGTGLGLAIVLQIVESFGGKVAVESTPGAGTTVTIHLPVLEDDE
ncbi:MAG: HAMP domain-containing protein [Deltaproteobacteria bacterium]|nr:MAG: HAMP domain-containing protein [Deltaproteobacteria bacterium]